MATRLLSRKSAALVALTAMIGLSPTGPAHAQAAPATTTVPDERITLEVVAANGSGCASGTAAVIANPDQSGFKVAYRDFVAVAGGGDVTSTRKNCQVAVLVNVPDGWTFAVAKAEYRGRAKLSAGASGLHRTNYYWQGSSESSTDDNRLTGPLNRFWHTAAETAVLSYQPCGARSVLNINTELRVDAGDSSGHSYMSMRTSEGGVDTLFNLSWKRC